MPTADVLHFRNMDNEEERSKQNRISRN